LLTVKFRLCRVRAPARRFQAPPLEEVGGRTGEASRYPKSRTPGSARGLPAVRSRPPAMTNLGCAP